MTTAAVASMPVASRTTSLIAAGIVVGLSYTLSPLTVISLVVIAAAVIAASRGLTLAERRWYWSILTISIVVRLIAIGLLFITADPAHPFASFFGDEELYKFRTIWLRNIGQGLRMSPADVIYSFDDVGHTSYIYVLAFVQALVGDAPYGLHVMNMALYLCGVLGLYRLVRAGYGHAVAMAGLILLLFLPSLGLWSISVLKEPMSVFMLSVEVLCAVALVRAPKWWQKVGALVVIGASALAMESLRTGGLLTAITGTVAGLAFAFIMMRGRRVALAMIAAPFILLIAFNLPPMTDRLLLNVRLAAFYHAGHVLTPGNSYPLLHPQYYARRVQLRDFMPPSEAARYTVGAVWSYFAQPLPWQMRSLAMRAYLPEQIIWYGLALLLPFGVYAGLKRDVLLTSILAAHAGAAILIVALSSGNIGTLIRHRALALPYIVWLSAVAAHDLAARIAARRAGAVQRSSGDGDR